MPKISGFLPSTVAFRFSNSFPHVALMIIDIPGQQIPIGDAANGLCGGMVFTVRDYFEAGIPIPTDTLIGGEHASEHQMTFDVATS